MALFLRNKKGEIVKRPRKQWEWEESKTEQHHEPETNINRIVARNGLQLQSDVQALQHMRFDDVQNNDFQEMMNFIIHARESFKDIPSQIRSKFGNDPVQFVDFVQNPENHQQLIDWGLAEQNSPAPAPIRVVMVDENDQIITPAAEAPAT
jgi:phage internal scaffolding protein